MLYHRPLNIATVPVKDGAQPLQQYHASGASHGAAGSKRTEPSKYLDYTWSLNLDLFHVKKRGLSRSLISHIPDVPLKSHPLPSAKIAESCPLKGWASTEKLLIQSWASTLWLFFPTSFCWRMLRRSSLSLPPSPPPFFLNLSPSLSPSHPLHFFLESLPPLSLPPSPYSLVISLNGLCQQ